MCLWTVKKLIVINCNEKQNLPAKASVGGTYYQPLIREDLGSNFKGDIDYLF